MADEPVSTEQERERERAFARDTVARRADRSAHMARAAGTAAQVTGATMQAGGAAVEGAGKATEAASRGVEVAGQGITRGGQALMRAGASLSATGYGAIAGVPLAIAGGALAGAGGIASGAGKVGETVGRGVEAGGRATRTAGGSVRQAGGNLKQMSSMMPSGGAGQMGGMGMGMGATPSPTAAAASAAQQLNAGVQRAARYVPIAGTAASKATDTVARIAEDFSELLPSLTVIGIIVSVFRLHHRLVWGNLFNGEYIPAKPLAAPVFWMGVLAIIDLFLLAFLFIAFFLIYMLANPCEFFKYVPFSGFFGFMKPALERACPAILNIVT
jgi:hypothetical protein